jgi:RNA polymerase sigma factor (sigma-70 family)
MSFSLNDEQREMVAGMFDTAMRAASFAKRKYHRLDGDDIDSAATTALIDAARTYRPEKGASFKTHATKRCYGAIVDYVRTVSGLRRKNRPAFISLTNLAILEESTMGQDAWRDRREMELPARHETPAPEIEREWDRLLQAVPDRKSRKLIRRYADNDTTMRDVAAGFGFSESYGWQLLHRARPLIAESMKGAA